MNGSNDLTNDPIDDILFSVRIDLSESKGFIMEPVAGIISPAIADILLALRVAQDTTMNEYYRNVSESMSSEADEGIESVVTKAESNEV